MPAPLPALTDYAVDVLRVAATALDAVETDDDIAADLDRIARVIRRVADQLAADLAITREVGTDG